MSLSKEQKQDIINKYGRDEGDTGSTAVQVALLTAKIGYLSEHLQQNRKDHHGRRGLLAMVGKRKRLLTYLERNDYEGYKELIKDLGLRR
jgi:small subunit ribosomal protein S15